MRSLPNSVTGQLWLDCYKHCPFSPGQKGSIMDLFRSCRSYAYSEEYAEYILETGGNAREIEEIFRPDCMQIINEDFVTIYESIEKSGPISFKKYGYGGVPKCFGLLDTSSVENIGALRIRRQPDFDLLGNNVLIGFVDTGE